MKIDVTSAMKSKLYNRTESRGLSAVKLSSQALFDRVCFIDWLSVSRCRSIC